MYSLKQLSRVCTVPQNQLLKDFTLRHRGKFFSRWGDLWYEFPSSKEVIVPREYALEYMKTQKRQTLPTYHCFVERDKKAAEKIPVAVLLGHFNHGKTTILDALGGTDFVSKEIHFITQEFRSRLIDLDKGTGNQKDSQKEKGSTVGKKASTKQPPMLLTMIDTPGQEIFFRIRDYGANIADIALLVVAADDGVCAQTEESIGILDALDIPVVVCINKVDKPEVTSDPNRLAQLQQQLREYVSLTHAPIIPVSAKTHFNIDHLKTAIRGLSRGHSLDLQGNVLLPLDGDGVEEEKESEKKKEADEEERVGEEYNLEPEKINSLTSHTHAHDSDSAEDTGLIPVPITGRGTIMNIWRTPKEGTMLHVTVKEGKVEVGSDFSAGGWAGVVRSIKLDDDKAVRKEAGAGYAVKLSVVLNGKISEPRPLGDVCYFHLARTSKGKGTHPLFRDKVRFPFFTDPKGAAEYFMEQSQFEVNLVNCAMTEDQVSRYRLNGLEERVRRQRGLAIGTAQSHKVEDDEGEVREQEEEEEEDDDNDDDDDDDEEEEEEEEEVEDYDEAVDEGKYFEVQNVVIKADSDISLSSIIDAIEEGQDLYQQTRVEPVAGEETPVKVPTSPWNVVYQGVGLVTVKDVTIAQAAKGPILCYGVNVQANAARQCQQLSTPVWKFDCMEDIVQLVLEHSSENNDNNSVRNNVGSIGNRYVRPLKVQDFQQRSEQFLKSTGENRIQPLYPIRKPSTKT